MAIDIDRVAGSALDAFMEGESGNGRRRKERGRRLGGAGAVALGVGLAVAARVAYRRARDLDLAQVAGAIEEKLRS